MKPRRRVIVIRWRNGCMSFDNAPTCSNLKICGTDWNLIKSLAKTIYDGSFTETYKNTIIIRGDPYMLELILCIAALTAANHHQEDTDPQRCATNLSYKPTLLYELAREIGNYLAAQPPQQQATQTLQQLAKALCKIITQ